MHELRVYTLQRKVLNMDIQEIRTVWKPRDHFPSDDPIGWKILEVEVLHNNWWLNDAHTVHAAGLHADLEVTVIYARNEIEAATRDDLDTTEYC